eukprot:876034-Prorocentrum_minimum.AAC.1
MTISPVLNYDNTYIGSAPAKTVANQGGSGVKKVHFVQALLNQPPEKRTSPRRNNRNTMLTQL